MDGCWSWTRGTRVVRKLALNVFSGERQGLREGGRVCTIWRWRWNRCVIYRSEGRGNMRTDVMSRSDGEGKCRSDEGGEGGLVLQGTILV